MNNFIDDLLGRQSQLMDKLKTTEFGSLVISASNNLRYLTGLSFHKMERPTMSFFKPMYPITLVLPKFEAGKIQGLSFPIKTFTYKEDPSTWLNAFEGAIKSLNLEKSTIGIDHSELRVFELQILKQASKNSVFLSANDLLNSLRIIKNDNELNAMQTAVDIAQHAFLQTLPKIHTGMTEIEIASELTMQIMNAGSDSDIAFTPIIASGPNSANPHATLSKRCLEKGDLVIMDWGARCNGYISDLSRTIFVGKINKEVDNLIEIIKRSNLAGCQAVKPGVPAGKVDQAARKVIEDSGYGKYFQNRTGHGIGLDVHEEPYLFGENNQLLLPGMTFTVEPGIYIDDKHGARIEDDVVVTDKGVKVLSTLPRKLFSIN